MALLSKNDIKKWNADNNYGEVGATEFSDNFS